MPEPYVIEPPKKPTPSESAPDANAGGEPTETPSPVVHRPRIGAQIMDKLDEILAHVKDEDETTAPEGAPEVTFEAEPSQLPQTPGTDDENPEDETTGEEEPKANTPELAARERAFHFPGRRHTRGEL